MDDARKSEKIADLASMFADVELEIIGNVLEMCQGKVNRAAEVLLKMQEDGSASNEKNGLKPHQLNEDFLEIDDQPDGPDRINDPTQVVLENENLEEEYLAGLQKAIALSLEEEKGKRNKNETKNPRRSSKALVKDEKLSKDIRKNEKTQSKEKIEKVEKFQKNDQLREALIQVSNPDEEVIQFIFTSKNFIRGETLA